MKFPRESGIHVQAISTSVQTVRNAAKKIAIIRWRELDPGVVNRTKPNKHNRTRTFQ